MINGAFNGTDSAMDFYSQTGTITHALQCHDYSILFEIKYICESLELNFLPPSPTSPTGTKSILKAFDVYITNDNLVTPF